MRSVSSRKPLPCPPYATLAAPLPDEALRPTVARRPLYLVSITKSESGFAPTDLYVRRFWSAVLGVEAIADLLRIVQAGLRGNSLRRPLHLSTLLSAGLVHLDGNVIMARDRIQPLDDGAIKIMSPALRRAHIEWMSTRAENAPSRQRQGDNFPSQKADSHSHVGGPVPKRHRPQSDDEAADPGSGQLAG